MQYADINNTSSYREDSIMSYVLWQFLWPLVAQETTNSVTGDSPVIRNTASKLLLHSKCSAFQHLSYKQHSIHTQHFYQPTLNVLIMVFSVNTVLHKKCQ